MIPKKIHYCWFGGNPMPEKDQKCIESWKKFCPDYEIIRWDESNYDISKNQYMQDAYNEKKWGFVPDFARLDIIYTHGGIYLDTDVELCKSLDVFLEENSFMGFESQYTICTAVIGAEKNSDWISYLLNLYNRRAFYCMDGKYDQTPNTKFIVKVLQEKYGLKDNDGEHQWLSCGLHVYPSDYFSPKNYATMQMRITKNTCAIHHYNATWKTTLSKIKDQIVAVGARLFGEEIIEMLKRKIKK
mgnify:CR=1 FL=1